MISLFANNASMQTGIQKCVKDLTIVVFADLYDGCLHFFTYQIPIVQHLPTKQSVL